MKKPTIGDMALPAALLSFLLYFYITSRASTLQKILIVVLVILILALISYICSYSLRKQLDYIKIIRESDGEAFLSYSIFSRFRPGHVLVGHGWIELWSGSIGNPYMRFRVDTKGGYKIEGRIHYFMAIFKLPCIRLFNTIEDEYVSTIPLAHIYQFVFFSSKVRANRVITSFYRGIDPIDAP